MRIQWILLARSADVGPRGLTIADGDVDLIGIDGIPGPLKAALIVHASGSSNEFSEPHTYRLRLLDPDGVELATHEAPVPVRARPHPAKPRHLPHDLNIVTSMPGFPIMVPGWYRIEATIDGDSHDRLFYVYEEVQLGPEAEAVAEGLRREGAELHIHPSGIYTDDRGLSSKASCSIWLDPDANDPDVGWGSTPDQAVMDASSKIEKRRG